MVYGNNSMKYEGRKFSENILTKFTVFVEKPYTCLGDSMWQGPKELIWVDCWGWTNWNNCVHVNKNGGLYTHLWPS